MSASPLPLLFVKAVRRGDTRTIDLFAEPEARPVAAPPPPRPAVSTPAATGPATPIKQLPVKVITRKDGHTQTYHVAPEDAPKAAPAAKPTPQSTHYRVHLTSPFGEFAVYVQADKQASLDDYRKDAKTAMVTDMGAAALSWSSHAQIKVVGEPEPVSSVPDNASQVRLAAWAHIAKVERTPAAQTDRTALLDDKEDLADERVRNPGSAKARELEARIAAAEGQKTNRELASGPELAPQPEDTSAVIAKAINRHLGNRMGDLLAPLTTATVMIPTYTKEDGTVVTAHPAKVRRRVKTVTAVTPRQAALEAAIDHLSTDSRQKDIPPEHRQEDAATVAKLKRVATQSPQKQEQALKEVVEHLEEDQGSPKLSAAEHKEDQALTDQLKAAVAPEALPPIKFDKRSPKDLAAAGYREFETQYRGITTEDLQHRLRFQQSRYPEADFVLYRNTGGDISLWWRPEGKPKPKWSEEPAPAGEILARYPNREDGVEGRVVQHADGRYAAILWDTDADHAVGIKIFPDLERAQEQARRMANAPAADAPDDLPSSVQPDPAEPEPTRAALTPTERDVQSYTQHLTTPAAVPAVTAPKATDENAPPNEADYPTATDYLAALRAWRERTGNRTAFEERKEARIERLQERASNAIAEGERRRAKAQAIGGRFELGQPIILGHHSEAGARRDRERMDQNMRASIEAYDKAGRLTERAAAAADNRAISADDEDAVVKLKARIEELEALQARMKAVNAAHARYLKDPASLEQANLSDREKERIRTYQPAYSWEPHPIAPWQLTNNSANLRRLKERLTDLTAQRDLAAEAQTAGPLTFDGGTVEANGELNRVQIFFDRKPAPEVRDRLKARGFRWAPSQGAWQRQLTAEALATAKEVLMIKAQRLPRVTLVRRVEYPLHKALPSVMRVVLVHRSA